MSACGTKRTSRSGLAMSVQRSKAIGASSTLTSDCAEWLAGHKELCDLIKSVLAECEVHGQHAEDALYMLRSLVRGFAVHQILGSFLHIYSYDESFERVVEIYVAGVRSVGTAAKAAVSATTPK